MLKHGSDKLKADRVIRNEGKYFFNKIN